MGKASNLRFLRSLLLFSLIPALAGLAPLLAIPAITSNYGLAGWATVALGMSVGMTTAMLAELGWSVTGPQRVALLALRSERRAILGESLRWRFASSAVLLPLAGVLAFLVAPQMQGSAALVAIGYGLSAISPSWYFVGTNSPGLLLACDTIPRVLSVAVGAVLVASGKPLFVFGLAIVVGAATAALIGYSVSSPTLRIKSRSTTTLREQAVIVAGRSIATIYSTLPATFVAMIAPQLTGLFAAIDRPMRMGLQVLTGVPARLQSWMARPGEPWTVSRIRRVLVVNASLGLAAGLTFTVAGPPAARLLFSGTAQISVTDAAIAGVIVLAICTSRGLGLAVIAVGRSGWLTVAYATGALAFLTSVLPLTREFGVAGALVAVLNAELAALAAQTLVLRRALGYVRRR